MKRQDVYRVYEVQLVQGPEQKKEVSTCLFKNSLMSKIDKKLR